MKAIVDLQSIARDHIPFNTAFLQIQRRLSGDEPMVMACREDHRQAISGVLSDLHVAFVALPAALHKPPAGLLVPYDERAHFAFIRDLCRRFAVDHLILLGVRPDLLDRVRRDPPAASVDILFHATLAEPVKWRSRNPLRRRLDMFGILRRRFPPAVRLIFLEDGIARQARSLLAPDTRTAVFPHPILGDPIANDRPVDPGAINVGFLGESAPGKGFDHFLNLARRKPAHLRLHCVGRSGNGYDRACDPLFATPPSPDKLTQAAFDRKARANDIIFLPLDPQWYDLVASGTLLDCVRFGIPPVIVRNAVVDAIEGRYGRFGFVVDRAEEAVDLIGRTDPRDYLDDLPRFRQVLHAIAVDRSIDAVCGLLGAGGRDG